LPDEYMNFRLQLRVKADWGQKGWERLTPTCDFPRWMEQVFNQKYLGEQAISSRRDLQMLQLYAACSEELQHHVVNLLRKHPTDPSGNLEFMQRLSRNAGALEWLHFAISKRCAPHRDTDFQKNLLILTNATISDSGHNAEQVVSRIKHAVSICCKPNSWPHSFAVAMMIRAFSMCHVNNAAEEIQRRMVTQTRVVENHQFTEQTIVMYKDEQSDQGDRLPDGQVNWPARYVSIAHKADNIVRQMSATVKQENLPESTAPVFQHGDWNLVDLIDYRTMSFQLGGDTRAVRTAPRHTVVPYGPTRASTRRETSPSRSRSRSRSQTRTKSPARLPHTRSSSRDRREPTQERGRSRFRPSQADRDPSRYDRNRQAPPTSEMQVQWYTSNRKQCLACGSGDNGHVLWKDCPIRQAHFPEWQPDWPTLNAVRDNKRAATAAPTMIFNSTTATPANNSVPPPPPPPTQPSNLGSRYSHMTQERDRSRSQSRGRDGNGRSTSRDSQRYSQGEDRRQAGRPKD